MMTSLLLLLSGAPTYAQSQPSQPAAAGWSATESTGEAAEGEAPAASGDEPPAPAEGEAAEGEAAEGEAVEGEVLPDEARPLAELVPVAVMRRYNKLKLKVVEASNGTWTVRDGQGYTLDANSFARLTEDLSTQADIREGERKGRNRQRVMLAVGGAMVVSSLIPIAMVDFDAVEPDPDDFAVDRDDFAEEQEYRNAVAESQAQLRLAQAAYKTVRGRNEDLRWTAVSLVSTGSMVMAVSRVPYEYEVSLQSDVAAFYTRDEAQARVDAYNNAIRIRLGIPAAALEAPETSALPLPMPRRQLTMRPVLAPGMVGLSGTF